MRLIALVRRECVYPSHFFPPVISANPIKGQSRLDVHCPPVLAYPLFRARPRHVVPVVGLAGKVGADAEDAEGGEARHLDAVLRA